MENAVNEFRQDEADWLAPSKRFDKWGVNKGLYVDGEDDGLAEGLSTNKNIPRQNAPDEDSDQAKAALMKKNIEIGNQFAADAEEYNSGDEESEDDEAKWDCESILSTYTNTDNHPGIIKTSKRIRPGKVKIDLHKQFRVPIEGLCPIAEEILIKKEKQPSDMPFIKQEDSDSEDFEIEETAETNALIANPKKLLKKEVKAEAKARRLLKKDLK